MHRPYPSKLIFIIGMLFLLSIDSFCASVKDVEGFNFPNQNAFSRFLKSEYDLIQNKWDFSDEKKIKLNATFFGEDAEKIPSQFNYAGLKEDTLFKKKHIKYVNWGTPLLFATYGVLFWDWGTINGFRTRDEGWFGKNTYAGGADKFAHMYSHYLISRASYAFYTNSGISHKDALKNSFILASSVGVLIEIGDGLSHYGFSFQDIVSDFVGIGFGHLLNSNAYLDELIGFQFAWWNNTKDPNHKGQKFKDPIDDYNNQKYIFNLRFAAIPVLRELKITRYLNFDFGFYSRGYKVENSDINATKREIFTGFSLNLTQLLRDFFPKSGFAYHTSNFLRYYQPPFTGFEANSWQDRD